jgi:hypothetical protein
MKQFIALLICILFAVPAMSQQTSCRGKKTFDLGDGAKGCIVAIEEGSITTTTTRDDGASKKVRRKVQPLVAALMTGAYTEKRSVVRGRMLAICNFALADVQKTFAGKSYGRIILIMDWRGSGGKIQNGFSNGSCRGFQFFRGSP